MESKVYILNKEIIIFEIKKNAQIHRNSAKKQFPGRFFRQKPVKTVIHDNAEQHNEEIIQLKIAIEPERHCQQKKLRRPLLFSVNQTVIAEQTQWEK